MLAFFYGSRYIAIAEASQRSHSISIARFAMTGIPQVTLSFMASGARHHDADATRPACGASRFARLTRLNGGGKCRRTGPVGVVSRNDFSARAGCGAPQATWIRRSRPAPTAKLNGIALTSNRFETMMKLLPSTALAVALFFGLHFKHGDVPPLGRLLNPFAAFGGTMPRAMKF